MDIQLRCQPSYTLAFVVLDYEETVQAERGSLVAMSAGIEAGAGIGGQGVVRALGRKALGGETFFMGRYTAFAQDAWIALAPPMPGDIAAVDLVDTGGLIVQQGSFLAGGPGVEVDIKYAGLRTMLLREGIVVLRLHGDGTALIASYGGLLSFDIGMDETMVVDTGHLVAWSETMGMRVSLLGGAITSAAGGEGLVATMQGPGKLWIQTRSVSELGGWLFPNQARPGAG